MKEKKEDNANQINSIRNISSIQYIKLCCYECTVFQQRRHVPAIRVRRTAVNDETSVSPRTLNPLVLLIANSVNLDEKEQSSKGKTRNTLH